MDKARNNRPRDNQLRDLRNIRINPWNFRNISIKRGIIGHGVINSGIYGTFGSTEGF